MEARVACGGDSILHDPDARCSPASAGDSRSRNRSVARRVRNAVDGVPESDRSVTHTANVHPAVRDQPADSVCPREGLGHGAIACQLRAFLRRALPSAPARSRRANDISLPPVSALFRDRLFAGKAHEANRLIASAAATKVARRLMRNASDNDAARSRQARAYTPDIDTSAQSLRADVPLPDNLNRVALLFGVLAECAAPVGLPIHHSLRAPRLADVRNPRVSGQGIVCAELPRATAALGKLHFDPGQRHGNE